MIHPVSTTLVEVLIWVYRDQQAHRNSHRQMAIPLTPQAKDSLFARQENVFARLQRLGSDGALIATTAQSHRGQLHPDAEALHDRLVALSNVDPYGAYLVARHALWAAPPDYDDTQPIPGPTLRLGRQGQDEIIDNAVIPGNGSLERTITVDPATGMSNVHWVETLYPYCPLTYWPSHEDIRQSQLEYRRWIRALTQLQSNLPALRRWRVEGLGAIADPWNRQASTSAARQSA